MTTATKAAYETHQIDPAKYLKNFAEWKHPKDVKAQEVCKYNTIATFANTMLVSTIVNVAVACFSNFIVLGIVLTAVTGFAFMIATDIAKEMAKNIRPVDAKWKPVLLALNLGGNKIPLLFRCFTIPKEEAAPVAAEGQAAAAPSAQGQEQSSGYREEKAYSGARV